MKYSIIKDVLNGNFHKEYLITMYNLKLNYII